MPIEFTVGGTAKEVVQSADALHQYLDDLIQDLSKSGLGLSSRPRGDDLAKADPSIKDHPEPIVDELKRSLINAYEAAMRAMVADYSRALDRIAEGDHDLADLDDHPHPPTGAKD